MIVNNLLSVPIYEFQCEEKLIEQVYLAALEEKYTTNQKNSITLNNFYHEELFNWLDSCVEKVKKIYYIDSINLKITNCWINKSKKLEYHHQHTHHNSVISGILYLTTHTSGETVFHNENIWQKIGQYPIANISNYFKSADIIGSIMPIKGKLVLFPSIMEHRTKPNTDLFTRYTLSFNSYFHGTFSWGDGEINKLHINTVGVRESNIGGNYA